MIEIKNFQWVHGVLNQPQTSIIADDCNAIIFRNTGTNPALINGDPLPVGNSLTLAGWQNEKDKTTYRVQWQTSSGGQIHYWRKVYM